MNVGRVILAHQTKYPNMTAWEFEEQLNLYADMILFGEAEHAWQNYLAEEDHEVFVERLRVIFSREHQEATVEGILEGWAGE